MGGAGGLLSALTALLSKRRAGLEILLAKGGGAPTGERLHDIRVVLRRTVAISRLTRDIPGRGAGDALCIAARDLRRALGARRTQEVAAALLRTRFRRDARRRPAAERLAARLERDAGEGVKAARLEELLTSVRHEFAARVAALARLVSPLASGPGGAAERRLVKDVTRRLRRRARRLLERGVPAEGNLHEARIDARALRYGLEFAALPGAARLLPLLEHFQETAGRAHDRTELIGLVRRAAGALPAARRREILRLLPPLLADAERSLGRAQADAQALLKALRTSSARW